MDSVSRVIELVIVVLLPTAVGYAVIGGFRGAEPIERLGANLRRLRAELDATETRAGLTAKNLRLKALRGAYVDALCTACQRLEVSPPPSGGDRAPLTEIYRVEAALRQCGLDVRETAAH